MILGVLAIASAMLFAVPQKSEAYALNPPQGAVEINDADLQVLLSASQTPCDPTTTGFEGSCSETAKKLNGKILLLNTSGAMYRFYFIGDIGAWEGRLENYLPDGFYKVENKYYWVANNQKINLNKGKKTAYKNFMERIREDIPSRTAISGEMYDAFFGECYATNSTQCNTQNLRKYMRILKGKVVMTTRSGALAIIDPDGQQIFSIHNYKKFNQQIKSLPIGLQHIAEIPDYEFQN